MPHFVTGDMWEVYPHTDHFIITTNAIVTRAGRLVMGRGIAQQARDLFIDLDRDLAHIVKMYGPRYGYQPTMKPVDIFQVKHHWKDEASLELIKHSADMLRHYADNYSTRRFDLNFPGIGNGRLRHSDVKPLLDDLPHNVHIWTFA